MRSAHRVCRTVVLRLRFDDFSRATRSHTLGEPTAETDVLLSVLRGLLATAMPAIEAQGITLIGITFTNLGDARAVQLVLPFDRRRPAALDAAIDDVRDRYGATAITRAALLGRDPGLTVPLLPD
jgi:DNA polymerase-4